MSERFFLATPPSGGRAVLAGDEARHVGRDRVELDADEPRAAVPALEPRLTLAVALPKGERQKWMVEKLTELGVHRLVPLETVRGVAEATPAAQARLERVVIEACKQCGRNTLMEIGTGRTLAHLLTNLPHGAHIVIAHPDPRGMPLDAALVQPAAKEVIALVGPEGGFTFEELAAAECAGVIRVSLGPHILRVETAAIALAARLVSSTLCVPPVAGCG